MNNNGRINGSRKNFSQVSNHALQDPDLSLKAKGLYALIESYINIPNFIVYKTTLSKSMKDGKTSFDTAWKELKDKGYLVQHKKRNATNNTFYYEYDLLEIATTTFSTPGVPTPGKGGMYINNDSNNIDLNNNNSTSLYQDDDIIKTFLQTYYNYFGYNHRKINKKINFDEELTTDQVKEYSDKFFDDYSIDNKQHNLEKCSIDNFVVHLNRYMRE